MGTPALIAVIALAVVAAGALYYNLRPEGEIMMEKGKDMVEEGAMIKDEGEAMMEKGDALMEEGENMMKKDGEAMMEGEGGALMEKDSGTTVTQSAGAYEAYAPEKLARAENGDVVIFFSATWCPTCRALNKDIEANQGNIPSGVTILQADYDRETALRQKYGVTRQHTLVQVAADGTLIKKWTGAPTLARLVEGIE